MNSKATLGLLLFTLGGLLVGAWLAAEFWSGGQGVKALPVGSEADGRERSLPATEVALARPAAPSRDHVRPALDLQSPRFAPTIDRARFGGWVEDAQSMPIPNAHVALFAMVDDEPVFPALDEVNVEPNGTFYTSANRNAPMALVAYAPGFVPVTRRVDGELGARKEIEPLALSKGESISGNVKAGGEPLARAEIQARLEAATRVAKVQGGALTWRDCRFVWAEQSAETSADGAYSISGLLAARHSVRISTVRSHDAAIDTHEKGERFATAPALDFDFALPAARLELAFKNASGPMCCVEVQLEAGDRHFTRTTNALGRLEMKISPALAYPITAACGGFRTVHTQLRGLLDGEKLEKVIELEPQQVQATVIVDDAGTAQSGDASFVFHSRFPSLNAPDFERTVMRQAVTKQFHIENVPSGSWRVTVKSGRRLPLSATTHATVGLWTNCDQDLLIDVPDTGVVRANVAIVPRGYAQIVVKNAQGRRVESALELRDLHGEVVEFASTPNRVPNLDMPIQDSTVDLSWPTLLYSTFCGGTADLTISREDSEPVTRRLQLIAGQVTPVEVVLRAR